MTQPLTPADRAELRRLHERATAPPWVYDARTGTAGVFASQPPECLMHDCPRCIASKSAHWEDGWKWNPADLADMELVAAARNALPRLLDALDAADAEIDRLRLDAQLLRREMERLRALSIRSKHS